MTSSSQKETPPGDPSLVPSQPPTQAQPFASSEWAESLSLLSTPLLQTKLSSLQSESQSLSSSLTSRLASSPSGQSLLHIGPSLSTLPPDLSSLLTALSPLLKDVAEYQKLNEVELVRVVAQSKILKRECKRAVMAQSCQKFLKDLTCEEEVLVSLMRRGKEEKEEGKELEGGEFGEGEDHVFGALMDNKEKQSDSRDGGIVSFMASLERVAYFTFLSKEKLEYSKDQVTKSLTTGGGGGGGLEGSGMTGGNKVGGTATGSTNTDSTMGMTQDLEMAQFVMKLSPRIRNLEKNVNQVLNDNLERILQKRMEKYAMDKNPVQKEEEEEEEVEEIDGSVELLVLGHILRSFVFMNRGSDAEAIFARVAIMPIVRKYVSIGKLDEGGSRGECTGLKSLLQQIVKQVREIWGDVLRMAEIMFAWDDNEECNAVGSHEDNNENGNHVDTDCKVEIDLITAGVWVPIVTALLTDPVMKVAIFSPGIASIFQRNYLVLDTFLSELAGNLLTSSDDEIDTRKGTGEHIVGGSNGGGVLGVGAGAGTEEDDDKAAITHLYYRPKVDAKTIHSVQSRLYTHPMTLDYSKRWNLAIYYQLRFAEVCSRLEKAIKDVEIHGWHAKVFTGSETTLSSLKDMYGIELPFFVEFVDCLNWLWSKDVYLKPLTHRFLRGGLQLIGRVVAFVKEGARGEVKFGVKEEEVKEEENERDDRTLDDRRNFSDSLPNIQSSADVDQSYLWCKRLQDVAAVSWDISILEGNFMTEYIQTIERVVCTSDLDDQTSYEVSELVSEIMKDASKDIHPLVNEMWNDTVVALVTKQCTAPLAAVKGVAATYRMTNRPPPTQASPFVQAILRPLSDFEKSISKRIPAQIGLQWKKCIVDTVSEEYSVSVSELIDTVQKTEEALKNRKVRRAVAGGMSDGEKVRLQLYLDQEAFSKFVQEVGVDPNSVHGIQNLVTLTQEAGNLVKKVQIS